MAFVMWDVTSLTSARSTTDEAYGYYYGTKFGVKGHWVKIPATAPAIGNITLVGVADSVPAGLLFDRDQTTNAIGFKTTALTIVGFQKGGRWINVAAYGGMNALLSAGAYGKHLRLYYTAVNEPIGPTA